jgi:hypothetical protein
MEVQPDLSIRGIGRRGMSLLYGVFTTDGEYEQGNFEVIERELPELIKKLADSDVALFLRISGTQFIIGSVINLRIKGGRSDSRVFTLQYRDEENITLRLPDILRRYFPSAREYLQGLNYQVLGIWGEGGLWEKIEALGDSPLPSIGTISQVLAGKLLTGRQAYAETRDLFRALCLVSEVASILRPFESLGYTLVISRLSFVDADLLAGPNKPLNTAFDVNLDTGQVIAAAGLGENYARLVKKAGTDIVQRKLSRGEFTSKQDLAIFLTQESWKGLQGQEKPGGAKVASPPGPPVPLSAKEVIRVVLMTGSLGPWNQYISSPGFNIQELKAAIQTERPENLEPFFRLIHPSLLSMSDPLKTAIIDVFMERITGLRSQADRMSGSLSGLKPETRQGPVKGKFPAEEKSLERELSRGRYVSLGILVLIVAVIMGGIALFLGWWPSPGRPSEQLSVNGETLAVLNMTNGTEIYQGMSLISMDRFITRNSTVFDNRTYYLNGSKIIDIEPVDTHIQGALRIFTPELTDRTGLIGHYNQSSEEWEGFIEVINQPDFTVPIFSGGMYGVFS